MMNNIQQSLDLQRLAKQKKIYKDIVPERLRSDWEHTGFMLQDMIQACVSFHRKKNKPLKTIYLKPAYYDRYCLWVEKKFKINTEENTLSFDGVDIEKGSVLQLESMYVDYYEQQIPVRSSN